MPQGREFEERVARILQELGANFVRDEPLGGVRPDFLVQAPNGKTAIIEVKGKQYQQATNADLALIVMPQLKRNFLDDRVVNEEGFVVILQEWLSKNWVRFRRVPKSEKPKTERIVFAAMPFDRKYDDTFFVAMTYAAEKVNAVCRRVDKEEFTGDIVEEIKRLINASIAVIVDLSESKENVLYEAGFAHALPRPTVHICSTNLDRLPFDVRNWNTIEYKPGGTVTLRRKLATRLASVLRQ